MLSQKIYALRRSSGLSQEQLAEIIGVSKQSISKWEGGLSTPELDKLRALSECFGVTIDELAENGTSGASVGASAESGGSPARTARAHKAGLCLCLAGAVCLILFGILTIVHPESAARVSESSVITLNGTGILIAFFVLLMISGTVLIFKKK